jgi:ATP-dependent RNA helicase DeaD
MLQGSDVIGQAQTGTGKTAAYALPLIDRIDTDRREAQVLVLTPTRELAVQVATAFKGYAKHRRLNVVAIYGGQPISTQMRSMHAGVHVLVATPGRLIDHMNRGSISLKTVQSVVLDEADEMLAMGFIDDVETNRHSPDGPGNVKDRTFAALAELLGSGHVDFGRGGIACHFVMLLSSFLHA